MRTLLLSLEDLNHVGGPQPRLQDRDHRVYDIDPGLLGVKLLRYVIENLEVRQCRSQGKSLQSPTVGREYFTCNLTDFARASPDEIDCSQKITVPQCLHPNAKEVSTTSKLPALDESSLPRRIKLNRNTPAVIHNQRHHEKV